MAFWDKLNQMAENVVGMAGNQKQKQTAEKQETDKMQEVKEVSVEEYSQEQSDMQQSNGIMQKQYTIFAPTLGTMGVKSFQIKEDSFVCDKVEYSYSDISELKIFNFPTDTTMSGLATVNLNGSMVRIGFKHSQKDEAIQMINYANERIAQIKGINKSYKFVMQSKIGSRIEVDDEYINLSYVRVGYKATLSNAVNGNVMDITIPLSDVDVEINENAGPNAFNLILTYNGEKYFVLLLSDYIGVARELIKCTQEAKLLPQHVMERPELEAWSSVKGEAKTLNLEGVSLDINESMDVYNAYRLMFRKLASECAGLFKDEYNRKIRNYTTFMDKFPEIYDFYLDVMCDKAMEIIISDGVWSVSKEDFKEKCRTNFHLAYDTYTITLESTNITIQNNQQAVSNTMGFVPHLTGGGYGLQGAAKGIAMAGVFNIARDTIASNLSKNASGINSAQQQELYDRIQKDVLFELVFTDYWRTYLCMIDELNVAGKDIWYPTDDKAKSANNIFKNMSSPSFPKDKITEVMVDILKTCPYNIEYHKYLVEHYGDTAEVSAIREYFGYTEFSNPRIV